MLTLDIDIFLGIGVMHGFMYIHQISIYRYQSLKLIFTPVIWYEDLVMWVSWTRSNITYLYLEKSRYSLQTWLSLLNSIPDVYAYCFVSIMHLYIRIKVIYRWPLVASLSNPEFWYIHLSLMMAQQAETRLAIDANFRYWYIFGYWSNAWLYVYTSDFYLSLSVTLKLIFTPVIGM